jgi:hypothetical protein
LAVSSATPTTIMMDVPPKGNGTLRYCRMKSGSTQTTATYSAPPKVMRMSTFSM